VSKIDIKNVGFDQLNKDNFFEELKEIFFSSSNTKDFKDANAKENFFYSWCGQYLEKYPDFFYLAFCKDTLVGYLAGCPDTQSLKGTSLFSDLYQRYPAHLHINCHENYRGEGIGKLLVEHFKEDLKKKKIIGVHLITAPSARNTNFYRRMGFEHEVERLLDNNAPLLFMGGQI